ncbi:N-6 DNA methylase, partial [candidate division KSB1 bacterium]|nr:N-6 DNA methylase [candidate division KSB1 bacterium]
TLIKILDFNEKLQTKAEKNNWEYGRGFENDFPTGDHNPSDWLQNYNMLFTKDLKRYGSLNSFHKVPEKVHRYGNRVLFDSWRVLIKRGISQKGNLNGQILSRLENQSYCFTNSIHGICLEKAQPWERKVLIGILWSSFARYFYFMTTSSWGTWHHEIHLEDGLLSLPVRFPKNEKLRARIVKIVEELVNWDPEALSLLNEDGLSPGEIQNKQNELEKSLDAAIFDLFDLDESERDLILDTCETGLEFFYRKSRSQAVKPVHDFPHLQGVAADLPGNREAERGLEGYLYAFLQIWNEELQQLKGEFRWRIVREPRANMLAVIFSTQFIENDTIENLSQDDPEWNEVLFNLEKNLQYPVSQRIYIDGMIRAVIETDIIVIKKNQRRLWTRSLAREDAEATLVQAIALQKAKRI